MSDTNEILFSVEGQIGRAHLNQPKSLNALTKSMCIAYRERLLEWSADASIKAIVLSGEGDRAFCAGGDVRSLYFTGKAGKPEYDFFWHEYRMDTLIHDLAKPHITLQDGVTMGGGIGISVHGSHRIATDRTLYAMPETSIGLFPDVGGTEFLPRAPGRIGMYLALTGARFHAADGVYAGIATHYVPTQKVDALMTALTEADLSTNPHAAVDTVIARFSEFPAEPPLAVRRATIDRCFDKATVTEILAALRADDDPWAQEVADDIATKSPTSLLVTHRQIRDYAGRDFKEIMRIEYRMACRFMDGHDFYEGIRAALVDKDRSPKWDPDRLDGVSNAEVDSYFAPHNSGELSFD